MSPSDETRSNAPLNTQNGDVATPLPERSKAPKAKKEKGSKQGLGPSNPKAATKPKPKPDDTSRQSATDADAMFKVGFLSDVYQERPVSSDGIQKVVTRFPPEPNGFLHIGHSKAIAVNFGFAKYHGGECYLRLDDTNPEEEDKTFETSIIETVRWLGFEPKAVTYSSDNFDRLYQLAENLIETGGAYVCYCTRPEIIDQRGGGEGKKPRYACPHRDRPVDENLSEFRAMRDGKYKPNEASLRMKQNLNDGNPQMWDLVAYRIPKRKESEEGLDDVGETEKGTDDGINRNDSEPDFARPHYRTGNKWKIYPSYDFCHCICDSIEGITHSLCTIEFELSRVSYEWLNNRLVDFKPMQREYGRLNVTGTVLSKRKINKLVQKRVVTGYDDPRLYTLPALRRRGIPPGAILAFVNETGVTKATTNIQIKRFEASVRKYLELTVPRLMLVLDPIKVVLDNVPDDFLEMAESPFSKDPTIGSHQIPFTKVVYIERSDFREVDSPDYFRLAPGKTVGLMKAPYPITATTVEKDPATGFITTVHATYEKPAEGSAPKKPKSWVHWVGSSPAHNSPIKATVRVINALFKSENPDAVEGGFLADINPKSETYFPNALIETGFQEIRQRAPWPAEAGEKAANQSTQSNITNKASEKPHAVDSAASEAIEGGVKEETEEPYIPQCETIRFQGMRMGYFCVDKESREGNLLFNQIVSLKEDSGKD